MDLPYPSQREVTQDKNVLNDMKRIKSTIWSMKDLGKEEESLSTKSKSILLKLIEKDNVKEISQKLKKNQIPFTSELGSKQSRWLILHFCARWNAKNTMEYIIKTVYHEDQQSLYGLINAKTCEGYTPLMISVMYKSNNFLKSMLDFGGVDIFLVDLNRVTAYQMAVSSHNESAITKLMDYEVMNKTSTYLNIQKLQEPFEYPSNQVVCCCSSLWYAFKDWVFRSPKNKDIIDALSQPMCTSRRTSEATSETYYRDPEFRPELESICRPVSQLSGYQIEWIRIQDLYDSDKGIRLFETYNSFDIIQTTFVLKHNLIVLQLLARNPMFLRRIIFKDQSTQSCYKVFLYPKGVFQRITIDDYIPCLKDKMEPMFITNSKQCWPLLLQKAWVKTYGSYVAARNIHPRIILHEMTGFFTETYNLNSENKQQLCTKLKKFSGTGFMTVLTSKQDSKQTEDALGYQSFTILNFYEKDFKKMYLVNCPFIIPKWKQKAKSEPFGLKLLKSHYNTMNQMSVWMDTPTLVSNFESFTVCHVMENSQRTQFQIKATSSIFFKFFIASEQRQKQRYYFKLYEYKQSDKQYYQQVQLADVSISRDDKIDKSILKRYQNSDRIKMIEIFSGQYFCKLDIPYGELRSYNLIIFGKQKLSIEGIDEEMGKIQWLYLLRDQLIKEALEPADGTYLKKEVQFFNYVLVIIKDLNIIRRCHKVVYKGTPIDYVIQGHQQLNNTIRLETHNDEFLFTMIKLKPDYKLSDLQLKYSSP